MNFGWSEFSLLIRLILDILCVWALVYAGIRIIRNNNRTIQIVKGILAPVSYTHLTLPTIYSV